MSLLLQFPDLVSLLRARALLSPDSRVYTFLVNGEEEGASHTYGSLDRAARRLGAVLQRKFPRGGRALMLFQPSLDFLVGFFGAIYGGLVAVPTYPPNPSRLQRTLPRFRAIVSDCSPSVILTNRQMQGLMGAVLDAPELHELPCVCAEDIPESEADLWTDPFMKPEEPAFLQYTSGSTGKPKGVTITHRNVMSNGRAFAWGARSTGPYRIAGVSWLPLFHDLGLSFALHALFADVNCVLMSPLDFIQRPARWLQAITRYRGEVTFAPNFAYELCIRKVDEQKRAKLDLTSLRCILNAAEPVRATTLRRFEEHFAPAGLRPNVFCIAYGLAEAVAAVSIGHWPREAPVPILTLDAEALEQRKLIEVPPGTPNAREIVGCGDVTVATDRIAIVDAETCQELPPFSVGEVWVQSPSVSKGYWQQPADTEKSFGARLTNEDGPFLRTGDLGCIKENQLYILGRIKEIIIIRGRNLLPHDIEQVVEKCHPLVRPGCCAAFGIEMDGEEQLGVALEVDLRQLEETPLTRSAPALTAVVDAVRQSVSEYFEVQARAVVLLKPGGMLKTSSGKLRRKACAEGLRNGTLDAIP